MALFDQILGAVMSGVGGQTPQQGQVSPGLSPGQMGGAAGAGMLSQLLLAAIAHEGGISGLMQKFQTAGMGDIMSSWVGTGPNKPVTPAALQQVLDPATVQAISEKTGIPVEQLMAQTSQHLPQMIDGLTPNGQAPQGNDALIQAGLALLKSRFGVA
jgi:uncharacterized protein YidB (DUF937 family)